LQGEQHWRVVILETHPDLRLRKLSIGAEQAPLLVIDNFIADPDRLVRKAAGTQFTVPSRFYPDVLFAHFGLQGRSLRFSMSHYSLVTTPPEKLAAIQRIPHVDSLDGSGLATIHYLFKADLGGTAFYRHRKTGFEYVDEVRADTYFRSLESENDGPDMPAAEYINGNTALFEQIASEDGVFNRMLVYRRNSLHSGCIAKGFVPDPNPLTGRLSVNCFIDAVA
jgi:hypothetical protein